MTTNHQRAVEILNNHWGVAKETGMADETECCVEALEEAGLLTPDQPEPNRRVHADNHTPHSLADNIAADERLMRYPKILSLPLPALVVALLIIQVAWQLGKMLI